MSKSVDVLNMAFTLLPPAFLLPQLLSPCPFKKPSQSCSPRSNALKGIPVAYAFWLMYWRYYHINFIQAARAGVKIFLRSWIPEKPEEATDIFLCIHGMSSHSGEFNTLGNYLASKGFLVYALDLRGNGFSDIRGDATLEEQLADIDAAVNKVKERVSKECIWLLGHSLGCGYALRYYVEKPENVRGLILIAPYVRLLMKYSPKTLFTMSTMALRFILTPRAKLNIFNFMRDEFKDGNLGKSIQADPNCIKEYTYRYFMNLRLVSGKALLKLASKVKAPP